MMFSRTRRTLLALAVACGLSAVLSASPAGIALAEKNDLAAVLNRGGFVALERDGHDTAQAQQALQQMEELQKIYLSERGQHRG
jgi:hypothetical protein